MMERHSERPHAARMDNKYAKTRHVYDLTRRYFLFGRDQALRVLEPQSAPSILEIGCGTGRNLRLLARMAPWASLYGVDISGEMLKTAGAALGEYPNVRLAAADASSFDGEGVFGRGTFDRVLVSYAISMIPDRQAALARAIASLAPGGRLVIVDFGSFLGFGPLRHLAARLLAWADAPPVRDLPSEVSAALPAAGYDLFHRSGPAAYYTLVTVERRDGQR